jgi:hypothetical protein
LFVGDGFEVTGDQGVDGRTLLYLERASQGISKTYRFTGTIPACVTVSPTDLVDPSTSGLSSPSARWTNRSTIAVGSIRSPSPISVTS